MSTTLGRAIVRKDDKNNDFVLTDTYDSDPYLGDLVEVEKDFGGKKKKVLYPEGEDSNGWNFVREDELEPILKDRIEQRNNTTYGRLRGALGQYGHTSKDKKSSKINTRISMNDIKKRLGDKLGKYDLHAPMSKNDFMWRIAGAGALTGAPIGAALGAISGAMMLISPKRRKRWLKTMLIHVLSGAGIAAGIGALGGGIAARNVYNRFEKKSESKDKKGGKKKKAVRKSKLLDNLAMSLSYSTPVLALAGLAGYGALGTRELFRKLLDRPYTNADTVHIERASEGQQYDAE